MGDGSVRDAPAEQSVDGFEAAEEMESSYAVKGRQDISASKKWNVVEHKRRQRRLFLHVPDYEKVQCQIYMALAGVSACRWVQTMGHQSDRF